MRMSFVLGLTLLATVIFPVMSQDFVNIANPTNSNILSIIFEKAGRCGETIAKEISQTKQCSNDESCYLLQETMLECLGEEGTRVAKEIIGDAEIIIEKVDEVVKEVSKGNAKEVEEPVE